MALLWWEKTVEYYFIRNYLENVTIAPFDGVPEKQMGDALASFEGNAVLIEFKRDENCLNSEKCKYKDWNKAKEDELAKKASFHLMVWGALSEGVFELKKCHYWDIGDKQNIESLNSFSGYVKTHGADSGKLKKYTLFLQENRKEGSEGQLSGGVELNNCAMIIRTRDGEFFVASFHDYERVMEERQLQKHLDDAKIDKGDEERWTELQL